MIVQRVKCHQMNRVSKLKAMSREQQTCVNTLFYRLSQIRRCEADLAQPQLTFMSPDLRRERVRQLLNRANHGTLKTAVTTQRPCCGANFFRPFRAPTTTVLSLDQPRDFLAFGHPEPERLRLSVNHRYRRVTR